MHPIFSIGDGRRRQCAMREDGVWFERSRVEFRGRRAHWSKWVQIPRRPDHAWYNPAAGRARLPKD